MKTSRKEDKRELNTEAQNKASVAASPDTLGNDLAGSDSSSANVASDPGIINASADDNSTSSGRISVAWPPFSEKLGTVLEKLEEDQFLILSIKRSNRFVQFAAQGDFGMRIETTSNSYVAKAEQLNEQQIASLIDVGWHAPTGSPAESTPENDPDGSPNYFFEFSKPVPFEVVANLAVHTLSEILRIPHPAFLQYEAFEDAEGESVAIPLPELGLKLQVPAPLAGNMDGLSQQLLTSLEEATGLKDLCFDDDGDIGVRCGSALVFVRLVDDPLYVRIYSAILRDVDESPDILVRLNDINASESLIRFIFRNGVIYGVADISAVPFVSDHVSQAFVRLCAVADGMDGLLQEEFGGQTAFVDSIPSLMKH